MTAPSPQTWYSLAVTGLNHAERNLFKHGLMLLCLTVAIVAMVFAYTASVAVSHLTNKAVPGLEQPNEVPTTGEKGYPVHEFCEDSQTTVTKRLLPPIDSTFAASYLLDRVKNRVHETIEVNVYADPELEPKATHYDSDNNPTDAFTSRAALACIIEKAK